MPYTAGTAHATNKADGTTAAGDHPAHHNALATDINALEAHLAAAPQSGAALVIAANDSPVAWKAKADYVCDGVADENEFAAAVTALPAIGGEIRLAPGTFVLGAPVVFSSTTKRITLSGNGPRASIVSLPNGFNAYAFRFTQVSGEMNAFVFRDFRVECNGSNQTAGGAFDAMGAIYCSWQRIHVIAPHTVGIWLREQPGGAFGFQNVVDDCLFNQGEQSPGNGQGVLMQSNDENLITNSRFQFMGGGGLDPNAIRDTAGLQLISNCVFVRGKLGVRVQDTNNTRINACTFDGCDHHGVLLVGGRHQLTNCHFTSIGGATANTYSCLYLEAFANQCVVSGNVFVPHGTAGQTRSLIREAGNGRNAVTGNVFATLEGTCGTAYVERNPTPASGISLWAPNIGDVPFATQTVVAGTAIVAWPTAPLSSGGSITMTAAPTIATGIEGQETTLLNVGANNIILQDQGTLASSNLRLTATTVTLGPRDSIRLTYSAAVGDWVQTGPLVAVL